MDLAARLIDRYFGSEGGELHASGEPVSEIARRFGTPLYVYDRAVLREKWRQLREALPPEFEIYYSVKANPNRSIVRCLLDEGAGLEIASAGEFKLAVSAGCDPERIVFAGPAKTDEELETVARRGIGEIHIESVSEAARLSCIARRLGITARVAIRVNPSPDFEGGAMRMGGRPAPFGVPEEDLETVLDSIRDLACLDLQGVHLFTGTQILHADVLAGQYRRAVEIAKRVARFTQRPLRTIDFGGGFGIPYFSHDCALDLARLRRSLDAVALEARCDPCLREARLIVEPGRFLAGEAGIYVARVVDVKVSRGKKFLILDGGMHHHLAASGNLGQTIKRNYPMAVINKLDCPAVDRVDVVGPLCTPLDTLGRGVMLPETESGDLIGVFQSGAYARSASPLGFLSHPPPPEILIDGDAQLIRPRGEFASVSVAGLSFLSEIADLAIWTVELSL